MLINPLVTAGKDKGIFISVNFDIWRIAARSSYFIHMKKQVIEDDKILSTYIAWLMNILNGILTCNR